MRATRAGSPAAGEPPVGAPMRDLLDSPLGRWMREHPRIVDAVLVVLGVLYSLGQGDAQRSGSTAAGVVLAVSALAIPWRRRRPYLLLAAATLAMLVSAVLMAGDGGRSLAWYVAFVALASHVRLLYVLIAWLGANLLLTMIEFIAVGGDPTAMRGPALLDPAAVAAIAIGVAIRAARARRVAVADLVRQRAHQAATGERRRITAEMHDTVAHAMTVMIALAGGAQVGWDKHPERARKAVEQIGDVGTEALTEMQRILGLLDSTDPDAQEAELTPARTDPELEPLAERFRAAGLPVTLVRVGELPPLGGSMATAVHRIVQEALTNALRHARDVHEVQVRVAAEPGTVEIDVQDDGRPVGQGSAGTGLGLAAMQERVAVHGGSFVAGPVPAPSRGWRLRCVLPWTPPTTDTRGRTAT